MIAESNLQYQLDEIKRKFLEQAPEEVIDVLRESAENLAASGLIDRAKKKPANWRRTSRCQT